MAKRPRVLLLKCRIIAKRPEGFAVEIAASMSGHVDPQKHTYEHLENFVRKTCKLRVDAVQVKKVWRGGFTFDATLFVNIREILEVPNGEKGRREKARTSTASAEEATAQKGRAEADV